MLLIAVSLSCFADVAYWTGRREYVTTVTGKTAAKCYYEVSLFDHRTILLVQKEGQSEPPPCPAKIEVE